jgi:[acyl-carrier-protein] S-malonyltransferase
LKKSIIFPGQGAQYVGMGYDLYQSFREAKYVYQEVDEVLKFKLSNIIFGKDAGDINLTANTQPAIMATGVAIFRVLQRQLKINIIDYDFCAGHSLGEYTALVCADSLSLEEAAIILKARGESMQTAVKSGEGAMAAILGAEIVEIETIINEKNYKSVEISNDNCPGQIVISGKKSEIENCSIDIKNKIGKKSIFLPVSAPFHCTLMKPAAIKMEELIMNSNLKLPKIPIISNVLASQVTEVLKIKKLLVEQIYKKVRWREIVEFMLNNSVTNFTEIGPGKSLSGMLKRFQKNININNYNEINDITDAK